MSKRILAAVMLTVCLVVLCACQGNQQPERFQVVTDPSQMGAQPTQNTGAVTETAPPADEIDYDSGVYDPASEEGFSDFDEYDDPTTVSTEPTTAPTIRSEYAGATPVVIDPIDKPTPTPAPALTITEFTVYDAMRLNMSFEGPVGWIPDDSLSDTYTITNPDGSVDYQAQLTVTTRTVSGDFSENDLKKEVKAVLNVMKADYSKFSPSNTASRTLMDKKGIYADFTGTRSDTGAQVWGRVHAVTVNKTLIVLRLTAPYSYREVYKDSVYSKFRHTVKFTK